MLDVLRNRLLVIALGGIAIAALAGLAGDAARHVRPIEQLTGAPSASRRRRTSPRRSRSTGSDEVGRLAASFNTMLIALDTSREQQQRLVVDASHELRTPLTAVRTNIDFLGHATTLDSGERAQLIAETRARARRARRPGERDGGARHRRAQRGADRTGAPGRGGHRRGARGSAGGPARRSPSTSTPPAPSTGAGRCSTGPSPTCSTTR